jgi:2-isopropylmalate synthase
MYAVYESLRAAIRLAEPRNKSIFGQYVFSTAAGIHQHGMLRNPQTYEFVEPELFGRQRDLVIGRHSGRAVLRFLLQRLNLTVTENTLEEIYQSQIAGRADGDCEELSVLQDRLAAILGADREVVRI